MDSVDFLLQLFADRCQPAQLNEPFPAIMGVARHPEGETAHVHQDQAATSTSASALIRRLLTRVSHTGAVEASPRPTAQPTAVVALGHSAPDPGAAADDLVLRRFPGRTLRDRQGLLRRAVAQAAAAGADGPGLSQGAGQTANACLAGGV